ncbi:hypothetical protein JB92DRAFT_3237561 [Gautieria morchelliformis]|nr:hypothetical protein JB92DRAFT_3237561 [Gautieria morchelliformis]
MSGESSPTLSSLNLTTTSEEESADQASQNEETTSAMTKKKSISRFYRDYRDGEVPHAWLQTFKLEAMMAGYDEGMRIEVLGICMMPAEESGDWWEEMRTKINRTKWGEVKRVFEMKWPIPKKSGNEREQKRYELAGLRIKAEEVGETVEYRGRTIPTHHAFAEQTLMLVMAIGETSGLLIDEVRRNIPDVICKLIANESYANWQEFHDSMPAIRMSALAEAKRDTDIIQQITDAIRSKDEQVHLRPGPHTTSMWHTQRTTITPTQAPATPSATRQNATLNLFHSPTNPFVTPTCAQGQSDAPQLMYNASLYDIWRPYLSSQAGQAAYERMVTEWCRQYAGSKATIENPFPLRPGGPYLDSRECFQCGLRGHLARDCRETSDCQVPAEEREWRACYWILEGHFLGAMDYPPRGT